jgi:hypothetical protein
LRELVVEAVLEQQVQTDQVLRVEMVVMEFQQILMLVQ